MTEEINVARAEQIRLRMELEDLKLRETNLRAELADALLQRDAVLGSTTWRATRPLRDLGKRLPVRTRQTMRRIARVTFWAVTLQLGSRLAARKAAQAAAMRASARALRESDDAFNEALMKRIQSDYRNDHEGNWDIDRFGPEPKNVSVDSRALEDYYASIGQFERVGYLYNALTDNQSKQILVELFAFLIMGYRKVRLQRNSDFYWRSMKAIHDLPVLDELKIPVPGLFEFDLKLLDLRSIGYDLKFFIPLLGANITFLQKQYELHHGNVHCKAEAGDVVIDAGGCWGDTALYFAHEVGPRGKVVSFEFIPSNLEVMRKNFGFNAHLTDRITVVPQPLWSTPDNILYYVDRGPASQVSSERIENVGGAHGTCATATIDQTVERLGLSSVDFIKMDIEGAELSSLKGAENTIRKFRPKLAVCLYHGIDDFRSIPRYIESLDLGYNLYLDHATIQWEETVLFCVPATR